MKWLALAAATAVLACGGKSATGPERSVPLGEDFALRLGESATVEEAGLRVTFAHVWEDSRCPPEAYCVWIGNARVVLDVALGDEAAELREVCTFADICLPRLQLDGYELELVKLDPPSLPRSAVEYRVTLRVSSD